MRILLKSYLLPALVIICLLGSWQGVIAPAAGYENDAVTHQDISETIINPESVPGEFPDSYGGDREGKLISGLSASRLSPGVAAMTSPVIVAVLDTGIDKHHEDLGDTVMAEINFTDSPTVEDRHGHGTHIAGIIAAVNDNNLGIDGVAPESRLLNVKVADDQGNCRMSALVEGIYWAIESGARVINISIEMVRTSPELEAAIAYAWENGAVIIAAAGNSGNDRPVYPAFYDNCIGVTALGDNGELGPLANYGDWVNAAVPGFNIYSTLPGDEYGIKHGTSFAAAYVSGLAAYLLPLVVDGNGNGRLNDEVRQMIINSCGYGVTL